MASDCGSEAIRPATAEEEASKRNTDRVYFLASPLTCKKGSDCEYRHNQGARMNPRDCWYWLKRNCLNPKCSFRHPPLDSWFATPMPSSGPLQLLQTAPTTQIPAACAPLSNNINKKSSPCYYFQRGQCLKGEWCPFIHGPHEFSNSVLQQVAKASTCLAEPPATIKDTQQNINMQQNAVKLNRDKPKATDHKVLPPNSLNGEPPALPHNPHNFVPTSGACSVNHQLQPLDEQPVVGRDTDELLHEYSPGFDVLVEDDIEDPDFFHNEDNFGRVSAHSGQHLEPENERHRDYEPMTRIERDPCNGIDKYDNYEQTQGRYVRRMNHQTKRPGRIKQQLSEDFSKDTATKSIRNKPTIGDDTNSPDFAGPKSIAEMKGARINGHSYERSIISIIANTNLNRSSIIHISGWRQYRLHNVEKLWQQFPVSIMINQEKKECCIYALSMKSTFPPFHE
ncbi:unnamed protein product [Musa acuminata subsp. malaccensis]|uniref:(wild Malaysian banana) hypothetical protein n=1 Tax=Musa acuminata subsp. malaccensis TaxID=214687 RepID=A0A804I6U0_MUSAM|nr:unnamed protein product [Musa acuminata subsp. malaccensis]